MYTIKFTRNECVDKHHTLENTVTFQVLSVVALVSEIGGSLGLFLGFSFLSLWDAFEFLVDLLRKLSIFSNTKVY